MASREVRNFSGQIIGFLEDEGDRIMARSFAGRMLGYYSKSEDKTRNAYGQIICTGDGAQGLIMIDAGLRIE